MLLDPAAVSSATASDVTHQDEYRVGFLSGLFCALGERLHGLLEDDPIKRIFKQLMPLNIDASPVPALAKAFLSGATTFGNIRYTIE